MGHIEELWITRRTLITYRDLAIESADWDRAIMLGHAIEMVSQLLEAAGESLADGRGGSGT
jgi:hypothetical protein